MGSGRFASLTTASAVDDNVRSDKRVRKLKKALKRIGELRHQDYLSLTTDQRVKVHGEHAVMDELAALLQLENADEREALRVTLQPGLLKPMPPSQEWSFEVSKERAKQKTRERGALEAELRTRLVASALRRRASLARMNWARAHWRPCRERSEC